MDIDVGTVLNAGLQGAQASHITRHTFSQPNVKVTAILVYFPLETNDFLLSHFHKQMFFCLHICQLVRTDVRYRVLAEGRRWKVYFAELEGCLFIFFYQHQGSVRVPVVRLHHHCSITLPILHLSRTDDNILIVANFTTHNCLTLKDRLYHKLRSSCEGRQKVQRTLTI